MNEWVCPDPLRPAEFAAVRRRLVLDHFKWDPQVGDVETLAPFPIVIPAGVASNLASMAEALAAETASAEQELLARSELLCRFGLAHRLRRVLDDDSVPLTPTAARVIRYDFHPTTEGWRISEANSDVPGGYTEAAHFTRLMAEHYPGCRTAGDPLAALVDAVGSRATGPGRIGFVAAPGFMEDQQVAACLADAFRRRGWATVIGRPTQVEWDAGQARLRTQSESVPLDAVVRFFQGEWLSRVPSACWRPLVRGGRTPVCNPGTALLAESKRFPLVWDELKTPMAMWRTLLPETRDPRAVRWRRDPDWLLKAAFGNNGDEVIDRRSIARRDWRKTKLTVQYWPGTWVVQRRFEALAIATPDGLMYPCLGVYTVDGRAAGLYGRMAPRPLIDYSAVDVAILVREDREAST